MSAPCHTCNISHRLGNTEDAQAIADQLRSHYLFSKSFDQMAIHLDRNEVDIESGAITFSAPLEMDVMREQFTNNDAAHCVLTHEYHHLHVIPDLS